MKKKTGKSQTDSVSQEKAGKNKKNTSLRLDKKTLKALKIHAIEQDTSVQQLVENLIREYLGKQG